MRTWLTEIRKKRNLKAREVAKKLNITPTHVGDIEKGKRTPSLTLAFELAILLEFDVYKFYEGGIVSERCDQVSFNEKYELI